MATALTEKKQDCHPEKPFCAIFVDVSLFFIYSIWPPALSTSNFSEPYLFLSCLQKLAVQHQKQKHHFSQIPFYGYIIEVFTSQHILNSSIHPPDSVLKGSLIQSLLYVSFKF